MTVGLSVEVPAAPAQRFDVLAVLDRLRARVRSAEDRVRSAEDRVRSAEDRVGSAEDNAANLERALVSNRRIGIAVGILMCQRQLTADQAFALLATHSQHRNVKVRELAETVIYTGTL